MADYRSSGRELRKSPKGVIAWILAVLLAGGALFGYVKVERGMVSLRPTLEELNSNNPDIVLPGTEETKPDDSMQYATESFAAEEVRKGPLILVNDSYPLEDEMTGDLASVFDCKNEYYYVRDLTVEARPETINAFNRMASDFYKETGKTNLLIMNGYRSRQDQRKLYESDLQQTGGNSSSVYSVPGCSDLGTGYTLELAIFGGGEFTGEGDYAWINEHCADYGFVWRYPEGKEDITKPRDGKCLLRYVGIPHSLYMYKNNLCLEEYVELLESYAQEGGHLWMSDAKGQAYEAYYCSIDPSDPSPTVTINVPATARYTVSGNNRHGFFVTMELNRNSTTSVTEPVSTETTTN